MLTDAVEVGDGIAEFPRRKQLSAIKNYPKVIVEVFRQIEAE
jgi:hypothetical protein